MPNAPFHIFYALFEMAMTREKIAPCVHDCNEGLAIAVCTVESHLLDSRVMAELVQIISVFKVSRAAQRMNLNFALLFLFSVANFLLLLRTHVAGVKESQYDTEVPQFSSNVPFQKKDYKGNNKIICDFFCVNTISALVDEIERRKGLVVVVVVIEV